MRILLFITALGLSKAQNFLQEPTEVTKAVNVVLELANELEQDMELSDELALSGIQDEGETYEKSIEVETDVAVAPQTNFDDRYHTIKQIANENGFSLEAYNVTTEDGYILEVHRIPPFGKDPSAPGFKAPVVFIQHGIEDSSVEWVINSPDKAPGFMLAKAGYDVWLGNNRGNDYGRHHVNLTSDQKGFWDFDFEEMGLYDLPAMIDFALEKTKDSNTLDNKLAAYIGHSEGTTQMFIGASMKPDYFKEKVNIYIALAPIVRIDHSTNKLMVYASQINGILPPIIWATHMYNIIDFDPAAKWLSSSFCRMLPHFCTKLSEGFWDWKDDVDNSARKPDKMFHSPAGAGWRCIVHYAQIIKAKAFQRYDFGADENTRKYGQKTPPVYDLSKISVKMAIAHGDIDQLSNIEDDKWLLDESQSGLKHDLVVFEKMYHFGHSTFSMGSDMSFITDDLVPLIAKEMAS